MMKKKQYKTRYIRLRFTNAIHVHRSFPFGAITMRLKNEYCVVLNKSIKLNILFICCIAHADDDDFDECILFVCLSIKNREICIHIALISFYLFTLSDSNCIVIVNVECMRSRSLYRHGRVRRIKTSYFSWCNANILWNWLYFPQYVDIVCCIHHLPHSIIHTFHWTGMYCTHITQRCLNWR